MPETVTAPEKVEQAGTQAEGKTPSFDPVEGQTFEAADSERAASGDQAGDGGASGKKATTEPKSATDGTVKDKPEETDKAETDTGADKDESEEQLAYFEGLKKTAKDPAGTEGKKPEAEQEVEITPDTLRAEIEASAQKPEERFEKLLWHDLTYTGAFGTFGDYSQNLSEAAMRLRGKNPLVPPSLASVYNLYDVLVKRLYQQRRLTLDDFYEAVKSELPAVNYGGELLKTAAGAAGVNTNAVRLQDTQSNITELKRLGNRFLDEIGESRAVASGKAEYTKTWKSPYYSDLNEALLVGDREKAKKAVASILAEAKTPDDLEKLMAGVKTVVGMRRPLRAGGVDAETQRVFRTQFIDWLDQRRPEMAVAARKIDDQYMRTAHELGLAKDPREISIGDRLAIERERKEWENKLVDRAAAGGEVTKKQAEEALLRLLEKGEAKPSPLLENLRRQEDKILSNAHYSDAVKEKQLSRLAKIRRNYDITSRPTAAQVVEEAKRKR